MNIKHTWFINGKYYRSNETNGECIICGCKRVRIGTSYIYYYKDDEFDFAPDCMKLKEIYEAIASLEKQRDQTIGWKTPKQKAKINERINLLKSKIKNPKLRNHGN